MSKQYKQLKDIRLKDILDLASGPFRNECIQELIQCGFIEEEKSEWKEINLRSLDRIRPGVTLKRIIKSGHESIIDVLSDPYWVSWHNTDPHLDHILVISIKKDSGHGRYRDRDSEYSINDLFNGKVFIEE